MFKGILLHLKLTFYLTGHNILRAMEYRAAFIFQVLGMFINNFCWLGCWYLFFLNFPEVMGWRFKDSALLLGFSCISVGALVAFFGGARNLSRIITRGELDYFLGFPKNLLWHLSVSSGNMSGLGDIFSGLIFVGISIEISTWNIFLISYLLFISIIALYGFVVFTGSISFLVGNFESAADELFWSVITFGIYPSAHFHGVLKIIICTVIPAFFIFILPVESIRSFSWTELGILTVASFAIFVLGIATFYTGLKRYESGNLIQIRV